jgi:DNA-binding NarL/FixJ family response regulator
MPPISVVITERRKAGRAACRSLLEPERGIRITGEAHTAPETVNVVARLRPSVLVLDAALFEQAPSALVPLIRRKSPHTRVLLLTDHTAEARTLEMLCHGARGYLDRGAIRTHLPRAVRAVAAGQAWVPRRMVVRIMERLARLTKGTFPAAARNGHPG